jgi:tRNA (cytidine/uridine-2'-O-)-methyltransferase
MSDRLDAPPAPGLTLLLYGLQSPINLGMILRVAETYRSSVYVFDPHFVFADPHRRETISDFACGALERVPPEVLADPADLAARSEGSRLIVTTISPDASALEDFAWRPGDMAMLGNEYDGLPAALQHGAAARLRIPMPSGHYPKPRSHRPIDPSRTAPVASDGMPSLNVAISAAIILYSHYVATHKPRP